MDPDRIFEALKPKSGQPRKRIADLSGKALRAQEIALQVFRLCYPMPALNGCRLFYNNTPVEPFLRAEHPSLSSDEHPRHRALSVPLREFVTIDICLFFDKRRTPEEAFLVEVVFPEHAERARWSSIIRVRWADLAWGVHFDAPVPVLAGETFVSDCF